MQYHEIVKTLSSIYNFNSESEAVSSMNSFLKTLGERMQGGAASHLAAQLPEEFKESLTGLEESIKYSYREFIAKVAEREGCETDEAFNRARAVLSVLFAALTSGEFKHILDQLPAEYAPLFDGIENFSNNI
jgi:uncharacterized protein (DUF2267 family)